MPESPSSATATATSTASSGTVPPAALGGVGPIRLGDGAAAALRPAPGPRITGGFWARRRAVNAEVSIPQGPGLLESAGNLHDLRLAAGTASGEYRGDYPFMDSDVHKWLEAACWELAGHTGEHSTDTRARRLAADTARLVDLVREAQQEDGYLNTWFQVRQGGRRWRDLRWGHEMYCAGHLIQAGVAHHRATGRTELLDVAGRFADHLVEVLGPDGRLVGVCGHPEVETALVELARETGEDRYRELAALLLDRRGHGLLSASRPQGAPVDADGAADEAEDAHGTDDDAWDPGPQPGDGYWQDRVPVREATEVEGHAVRQLYLLAGMADLATDTGDAELRTAVERLWSEMTARRTHLTGGLGAHHKWEDFGAPYELPNERAYCETCAAVASVQLSWRLALLTGEAKYSDLAERTLYNALLAGVSQDGERWLYVNPLQVRDGYQAGDGDDGNDQTSRRTRWFRCACCPPNVMRLLASLQHYFASTDGDGLQLHQYATGRWGGGAGAGAEPAVSVLTNYPEDGRIAVTVEEPTDREWTLSLRVPHWCTRTPALNVAGRAVAEPAVRDGWLRIRRTWRPGDTVVLDLPMDPRLTAADPRVDAVRGCVAIERGPLVHCLEQTDHPSGGLDDVLLDTSAPLTAEYRADLLGGATVVRASGRRTVTSRAGDGGWWPYGAAGAADTTTGDPIELTAVPYHLWANRADGSMRVWLPTG